jgi:hypothetical protein
MRFQGGALTMRWSWRSTQWFMVIYGWVVFTVMVVLMPGIGGAWRLPWALGGSRGPSCRDWSRRFAAHGGSLRGMLGPMFAPIIGGALTMRWSWRSTQWFMVIYGWVVLGGFHGL